MKLLEVVVATAIGATVLTALVLAADATVRTGTRMNARLRSSSQLDRLSERLESDAQSAWALFVPARDALGTGNADGHELDFAAEDGAHAVHRWGYAFDARALRVTRYNYTLAGSTAGDSFDSVTAFAAAMHPIGDLADPRSNAYDALLAPSIPAAVDIAFNWPIRGAIGGNRVARVVLSGASGAHVLMLAGATAPTSYHTIVQYTPAPTTPTP